MAMGPQLLTPSEGDTQRGAVRRSQAMPRTTNSRLRGAAFSWT
jgi:hypothetical protein